MSKFLSQDRPFQSGLIPVCMGFCLMGMSCCVDAGVMTSGSAVASADLLCGVVSSPGLRVWNLASAATVKSTHGRVFVDFGAIDSDFGSPISRLLLVAGSQGGRYLLETSASSSAAGGEGRVVAFFCGREYLFSSPSVGAWFRAMKLGAFLAVPPDELLRPPRD